MIIGTTSQLPTILIVTAIGMGIALILHLIKRKKIKLLVGGLIALAGGGWTVYSVFRNIRLNGVSGGAIGGALFALFIVCAAISLFVNMKEAD